jgi:RNA polymerase sigma factor (TIGR02999 family)
MPRRLEAWPRPLHRHPDIPLHCASLPSVTGHVWLRRPTRAWADGDPTALDELTPRVYKELRRIAGHCIQSERSGRTIQTTALVHEAYLKLVDVTNVDWQHRAHFFAIAAKIMRHILLDRARGRIAAERGGAMPKLNLDNLPEIGADRSRELIALDDALTALAHIDARKARVIELRFFAACRWKRPQKCWRSPAIR